MRGYKIKTLQTHAHVAARMIFRNELKRNVIHASALGASRHAGTLQCKPLQTSDELSQRRIKPLIRAQLCRYLPTQKTHDALALAHTAHESENRLVANPFPSLHDSEKRPVNLSTTGHMLAQPLMTPLTHKSQSAFGLALLSEMTTDYCVLCTNTHVENEYKPLYQVPPQVRLKRRVN